MSRRSSRADETWRRLVALVMESHDDWRRQVSEVTGLAFGRVRALRRLVDGPRTLHDLAAAISNDAPATTMLVHDLERRGLVVRQPHPSNRRAKLVSLTSAGRELVARTQRIADRAPPELAALPPSDLVRFARVIDALVRARAVHANDPPKRDKTRTR